MALLDGGGHAARFLFPDTTPTISWSSCRLIAETPSPGGVCNVKSGVFLERVVLSYKHATNCADAALRTTNAQTNERALGAAPLAQA
jgi:hypothetical protein